MNDEQLKESMQEAFGALHRPAGLDQKTLARIEALRHDSEAAAPARSAAQKTVRVKRFAWSFAQKAVAACLVLALMGFGGYGFYNTPVAYADVEADAGVELVVNRFDRVIGVEGLDEGGQSALNELAAAGTKLKGMSYQEALDCLTSASAYAANGDSPIHVTVACDDENRCARMSQAAEACLQERAHGCDQATMADHEAACAAGQGMHHYGQAQNAAGQGMHHYGQGNHHE